VSPGKGNRGVDRVTVAAETGQENTGVALEKKGAGQSLEQRGWTVAEELQQLPFRKKTERREKTKNSENDQLHPERKVTIPPPGGGGENFQRGPAGVTIHRGKMGCAIEKRKFLPHP